jgi:hypothetical protein
MEELDHVREWLKKSERSHAVRAYTTLHPRSTSALKPNHNRNYAE